VLRFEWNALRTGDHVLVHDPRSAEMTLTDGVVASVDARKGVSGVSIRVGDSGGETAVLWPSHIVVHRDPVDPSEACWRCQELGERAEPALDEPQNTAAVGADDGPRPEAALSLSGAT
jgi:hypothetical protein